jgi:hypothetical protein
VSGSFGLGAAPVGCGNSWSLAVPVKGEKAGRRTSSAVKEVDMVRCTPGVGLVAVLTVCPFLALHAGDGKTDDQKAWQQAELKKLTGRWTTVREENAGKDKIRRTRVDLEFAAGKLSVTIDGARYSAPEMVFVKQDRGPARLDLGTNPIYYSFVGEKLIVVGRILNRPFEGFDLSGDYKRPEAAK